MRTWLSLALLLLASSSPALADDFDFGEEFDEEPSGLGIPLRGKLALGSGYQIGEPKELVSLDTTLSLVLDWSGSWGQLAGEGDFEGRALVCGLEGLDGRASPSIDNSHLRPYPRQDADHHSQSTRRGPRRQFAEKERAARRRLELIREASNEGWDEGTSRQLGESCHECILVAGS